MNHDRNITGLDSTAGSEYYIEDLHPGRVTPKTFKGGKRKLKLRRLPLSVEEKCKDWLTCTGMRVLRRSALFS